MAMDEKNEKTKIRVFWERYEAKIILVLGFILIAVISFEVGTLKAANFSQKPLIIEKPAISDSVTQEAPAQAQNLTPEAGIASTSTPMTPANCAFVGSKNSNQYHLPTSSYAKRIKPENQVCFSSVSEAQSKGYMPDKSLSK